MSNFSSSPLFNKFVTALLVTTLMLGAMPVKPAYAASITVTTTADEYDSPGNGFCSLREAIANANSDAQTRADCPAGTGADTITLASGSTYTLSRVGGTTTTGDLDISDADGLTIQASGTTPAIIDANDIDRVIDVSAGNLTINYITVTNGNAVGGSTGGGIYFGGTGTLTVNNSTVSSSIGTNAAGCGGGIFNFTAATININNSTIEGNQCSTVGSDGGGLWKGSGGALNITNSTFYNNFTDDDGAGLRMTNGTGTISFSTFSNNSSSNASGNIGGAVQVSGGTLTITSSILANSTANANQNDCDQSGTGTVTLVNTSVEVNSDCGGTVYSTADPGLGAFQNNGGPTSTMAITDTSLAFNAATSCGSTTTDQRGYPRPQKAIDNCDLGAFELQVNDEPSFTAGSDVTVLEDSGAYSAAWATSINDGDSEVAQTLTFNVSNNNNSLFSSQPAVNSSGTLAFTPAANANGSATISVYLTDNGGTASGGDDTSATVNFTITVTAVNDIPAFSSGGDVNVNEDSGAYSAGWATGISDGDPEVVQALTFSVSNNNNSLFSSQPALDSSGNLTFTPAANAYGSATVSVRLQDNGGTSNGGVDTYPNPPAAAVTFTVTVSPTIDDAPTDISLSSTSVAENAAINTTVGTLSTTDPDFGDTFTYSLVNGGVSCPGTDNGSYNISGSTLQASASFDFETKNSYVICVRTTDSINLTLDKQFTINITNVNEAPTDIALSVSSISENQPINTIIGALTSTDVDSGDTHTYTLVNGGVSCPGTDNVSFNTNAADLRSSIIFDYETKNSYVICIRTTDSGLLTYDKPFTITITNVNDSPVITEGASTTVNMSEDGSPTPFSLTLNATDQEGDTITWNISSPAGNGTASASGTGSSKAISYSPTPNFNGTDSFDVQISDGNGGTDTITVNVNVSSVNDAPSFTQTNPVAVTMSEDGSPTPFSLTLNATDSDGDTITWSISSPASQGIATAGGTGTFKAISYSPTADYNGSDSFDVQISDGNGGTATLTVNVTINPVNDFPVISEGVSITVNMSEDGSPTAFSLTLNATDADADTITWSISSPAGNGTASASGTGSSKVIGYSPTPNYNGTDSFNVQVSDGNGGTDTITVNVNIATQSDPPAFVESNPVAVTMSEDGLPTAFSLTLNANDPDGDTITWSISVPAGNGTASVSGTGTSKVIGYTPTVNFNGSDSFDVQIDDGNGNTAALTVNVTINPVNDVPVNSVPGSTQLVQESSSLAFSAGNSNLISTADVDSGSGLLQVTVSVTNGTVTLGSTSGLSSISGNGTSTVSFQGDLTNANSALAGMVYAPTPLYVGSDTLQIVVNDQGNTGGGSLSDTDAVSINVANTPPMIFANGINTFADTGDGKLDENESVAVAVTRIIVRFDQDLFNPNASDPDSVTNPANFRLISDNGDGFQTTTCSTNVSPLDTGIPVTSVTYSNNGGLGPFIATVHLGASLQNGAYRLIVCGTTSITDLNGLTLAGDGTNANTDFNRNFTVLLPVVQTTGSTLPATGFPMGKVTTILPQPASLAYSSTDLWLEIPKLGVKMPIVGVPQTKNGWEVTWLNRDAGWLNGSAFPTWKGNSVLTAHVWDALNKPGPFAKLKELKYGDQVKVHAFGQVYVYEIRENATVLPRSLKTVFKHEEDSWITLITCEDYSESTKTYSYRRMVRATLVSVTPEN